MNGRHRTFLLIILFLLHGTGSTAEHADGWHIHLDFNKGVPGEKVSELGAAGRTLYTTEHAREGGQGAVLHAQRGKESFGRWGGTIRFPEKLHKGDEVWWRVHTYWPDGTDYSASPRLKFMRIHTQTASGKNLGYNDIYMNPPGQEVPFQYIYEGEHKWTQIGNADDGVRYDEWETYEFYLKLDDVSVADGGTARVRFWKNGKLLADITDRKTLKNADARADAAFLFTYWNSSPWIGRILVEKENVFSKGEFVIDEKLPAVKWIVTDIDDKSVWLRDPSKDWRKRQRPYSVIKKGHTLSAMEGDASATVTEVLHTHPLQDVRMYVDAITVTTQEPTHTDAQGHPCLGPLSARDNSSAADTDSTP